MRVSLIFHNEIKNPSTNICYIQLNLVNSKLKGSDKSSKHPKIRITYIVSQKGGINENYRFHDE